MSRSRLIRPLFGEFGRSSLWAACLAAEEDRGASIAIASQQVAFVLNRGAEPILWEGAEFGRAAPYGVMAVFSSTCRGRLRWGARAESVVVAVDRTLLAEMLKPFRPGLMGDLIPVVFGDPGDGCIELPSPDVVRRRILPALLEPAVTGPARSFWFEAQVKELIAATCFLPGGGEDEYFCSRQKRLAEDRVSRARSYLGKRLDEPLDLQRLATHVGCSPFHLSRTFSASTGMTLSQYLRKRRIERAADLIVTGRCNVSEAAIEVGYRSMSHFSKAFQKEKGCLPSKFEAA